MDKLIDWVLDKLRQGKVIESEELFEAADEAYDGTRAEGAYTDSDAFDACDVAGNVFIAEELERWLNAVEETSENRTEPDESGGCATDGTNGTTRSRRLKKQLL